MSEQKDLTRNSGEMRCSASDRSAKDRRWSEYPIGTKAYAIDGGWWVRVSLGWKWCSGSTFPIPGADADAIGNCIELPESGFKFCGRCGSKSNAIDFNDGNVPGIGYEQETKYKCTKCPNEWWD